jgi:hypothetical protein
MRSSAGKARAIGLPLATPLNSKVMKIATRTVRVAQQIFGQTQVWPSSTSLNAGFLVMSLTLTCLHRNDKLIGLAWFMNMGRGQFRGRPVARFVPNPKLKFLDQCHEVMRFEQLAARTEETYLQWIRRFILFHRREGTTGQGTGGAVPASSKWVWRHPEDMGKPEVREFLTDLAVTRNVSAATQNQALNALLYWSTKM